MNNYEKIRQAHLKAYAKLCELYDTQACKNVGHLIREAAYQSGQSKEHTSQAFWEGVRIKRFKSHWGVVERCPHCGNIC